LRRPRCRLDDIADHDRQLAAFRRTRPSACQRLRFIRLCQQNGFGGGFVTWKNLLLNDSHEAESLTGYSANQSLLGAAVADCVSNGRNSAAQRRVRNDSAIPNFRQQIVLADDAPAIVDEENQEVEDLRFDRDDIGSAPQFTQVGIERILVK